MRGPEVRCGPAGRFQTGIDMNKRRKIDPSARFLKMVLPEPNTGCWIWTGGTTIKGYGTFGDGTKTVMAHRFSYRTYKGEIPDGMQIDHLCRVRCCVNPDHLEAVSASENVRRSWPYYTEHSRTASIANLVAGLASVNRSNAVKTHCVNGHEYNSVNTRFCDAGPKRRICIICLAKNSRRCYEKRCGL